MLWLLPAGAVRTRFTQIIAQLAAAHDSPPFDAHVTLLEGIECEEDVLRRQAAKLAHALPPITLQLTEADYLDEYHRALFVRVAPTAELLAARETAQAMFQLHAQREFMPHLSLLYGQLPAETKEKILTDIGWRFDLSCPATDLLLVAVAGAQPNDWRYLARLPLWSEAS